MHKIWMITGAGRGLGRAFTDEAVKNGDFVIATVRKLPKDDPLFTDPAVLPVIMDVTNADDVKRAVSEGYDRFGRIDYLINNAGYGMAGSLEEFPDDAHHKLFETDYFGVVNVIKAVLPVMRAQRSGRILNISSLAGLVGVAGSTAYNAAKFAIVGLSESLNEELKPFNIQVVSVCPGPFRTDYRDSSSLVRSGTYIPDYDGTPGHDCLAWMTDNNHKQAGDPEKAAAFVYKVVTGTDVPLVLALGKQCSDMSREMLLRIVSDIDTYYDESCRTAFEDI